MDYEKATAEIILFSNRDVITTSGGITDSCRTPGQDRGNGCGRVSGTCPGQSWK